MKLTLLIAIIAGVVILAGLRAAIAAWRARWKRERMLAERPLPPLVIPVDRPRAVSKPPATDGDRGDGDEGEPQVPRETPAARFEPGSRAEEPPTRGPLPVPRRDSSPPTRAPEGVTVTAHTERNGRKARPTAPPEPLERVASVPVATEVHGPRRLDDASAPVRAPSSVDETLQFLPGRLEIVRGQDLGQEIRFVRTRGGAPRVTFGRRAGTPFEHVQLLAPTVSRDHARMVFEREQWRISNLSRTNPVIVNGESLGTEESRTLAEGDTVEIGEFAFRFRRR